MSFVDKTPEQVSSSMNSVGKGAVDNPQRAKVIQRLIDRCKGFSGWGDGGIYSAAKVLQTKAIDAGNPAAVAQSLWVGFAPGKVEELDAKAKGVLNAGNIDGDVIKGIYDYLLRRNGNDWLSQYGDPAIMAAAWALLQCNYGSDCSGNNRTLVMSCVYLAACEQTDVASLLPLQYPSLTPEKMQQAIQAEELLGSQIQSHDWARLGFGWSGKSSSPK
jgi:hypothetical protein